MTAMSRRPLPAVAVLAVLLAALLAALTAALPAPRPQDASTNNIVAETLTDDDRQSLVADLILAVARDWDMGRVDATEFIRAVPAISLNGTTFGPTTHPINQSGPISFEAPADAAAATIVGAGAKAR